MVERQNIQVEPQLSQGLIRLGTHRLTWEAKDGCKYFLLVHLNFVKDCKAPATVAMQVMINLTAPLAMAEIWASDFNNLSSDNCTPANLAFKILIFLKM
ncbi:MAG: hypothetical protein IPG00_03095 [Saprospiraceae bacterium]|nr:hypothetical protein [Saprospiraceae bacterium]